MEINLKLFENEQERAGWWMNEIWLNQDLAKWKQNWRDRQREYQNRERERGFGKSS